MESNNNARDLRAVSELLATLHVQSLEESFCEHCRHTEQARQWVAFTLESINAKTPAHRALSDLIYSTAEVDEESAYQWTFEALEWLQEQLQDNKDATLDNMDESGAINEYIDGSVEIYNFALLQWLTKGNNHVYIEDALSEFGMPSKGNNMQLISMAQYKARADHFYALLQVAREYATAK